MFFSPKRFAVGCIKAIQKHCILRCCRKKSQDVVFVRSVQNAVGLHPESVPKCSMRGVVLR
jgi:hypothetical protein